MLEFIECDHFDCNSVCSCYVLFPARDLPTVPLCRMLSLLLM